MGSVVGKPDVMKDRVGEGREPALGEVQKLAAAYLTHPGVERPVVVREKRHELAIGGDARIELGAFPGRETAEASAGKWVLPEVVALTETPSNDPESQQNRRGDHRRNPPALPRRRRLYPTAPTALVASERLSRIVVSSRARSSVEA